MDQSHEPHYFADPANDRMLGVILAMATELYVTRDRLREMESLLVKSGHLDLSALQSAPANDEARRNDASAFVSGLLTPVLGTRTSRMPE